VCAQDCGDCAESRRFSTPLTLAERQPKACSAGSECGWTRAVPTVYANPHECHFDATECECALEAPCALVMMGSTVRELTVVLRQSAAGLLVNHHRDPHIIRMRMFQRRADLLLRRVGIEQPAVEVRFQNLHVETSLYMESSRNLPTILNAYRGALEVTTHVLVSACCATLSTTQLDVGFSWHRLVWKQPAQPALAAALV